MRVSGSVSMLSDKKKTLPGIVPPLDKEPHRASVGECQYSVRQKKSLPGIAVPERETETDVLPSSSESSLDSIINSKNGKSFVYDILLRSGAIGEKNGIHAADLYQLAGFQSDRELRAAVAFERRSSVICSSGAGGYFLPDMDADGKYTEAGIAEIERYYRCEKSKAISIFRASKTARHALNAAKTSKSMAENRTLFDEG